MSETDSGKLLPLRCAVCGNAKLIERLPLDPPQAVELVTNECDICEAANGGFGDAQYYDNAGRNIDPECAA